MPKNDNPSDQEQFNLKHRATGAAVLIFLGALVLPWLLGPPSEAKKVPADQVLEESSLKPIRSTFEDEVLTQLQEQTGADSEFEEPEETVYISKITPFDGRSIVSEPRPINESDPKDSAASAELAESKASSGQKSSSTTSDKTKQSNVAANSKSKVPTVKSSEVKPSELSNKPKKGEVTNVSVPSPKVAKADTTKTKVAKAEKKQVEKANTKTATAKQIDVGWIVQVELLTDKKGAARLVDKLKEGGFKPKTTIVDTNKGKATGTRIWVGPFENRSSANSKNQQLEAKMGKRGFIRVYP